MPKEHEGWSRRWREGQKRAQELNIRELAPEAPAPQGPPPVEEKSDRRPDGPESAPAIHRLQADNARPLEGPSSETRLANVQKKSRRALKGADSGLRRTGVALNPRSGNSRHGARRGPPQRWPHRQRLHGIALFGVMAGAAVGAVITDPAAWRELKLAVGLPVAHRAEITGRPARITDGDTFRLGGVSVRLHGVDAPEMSTSAGGPARDHLVTLVGTSPGPLRCEDTGERTYERIVAQCFTADGRDLSAAMAEDGWAEAMLRFSGWPYLPAQVRAMWARRGMHAG